MVNATMPTMIEKIIANHTTDTVKPGEIVWMDLDVRAARDFAGANVVNNLETHYPSGIKIEDLGKTFFTFDCVVPANNVGYAQNQQIIRDFSRQEGVKLYDVNEGIGSHVFIEKGIAYPGSTVVSTDSHFNILGAVGSFGQGMGDQDIAFGFKTGKTWFEVPASAKVNVKGQMGSACTPKDVTLALVKHFGAAGLLGIAAEFCGAPIDRLDLSGRITLCSMVTEMGGITGFVTPNKEIIDYCRSRSETEFETIQADEDATYTETFDISIDGLKPQIACPYAPDNVKDVEEVAGRHLDAVVIGSCTNGRYEDFALAAKMLKGKSVAEHVMMKIVPATKDVYGQLLKNGLMEVFFDAGAIVSNQGCSTCAAGQIGMTGKGEVQITTGNRNFAGKQGKGDTYLAGPAVATASAIAGEIAVPK